MNTVAFIIPCLNEEKTLSIVLDKINDIKKKYINNYTIEIIVVDNGSTDNSVKIALDKNVTLVECEIKGYGAVLKKGIFYSKSDIIIFGDADNTYNFNESIQFIEKLINSNSDLVLGNRLNKKTKSSAMPFLHRYLGTPILSFLINLLYSNNYNKIKDCNSGLRCFYRKKFLEWHPKSNGMEFASEMLILAQVNKSKISEIDIELHTDIKDRKKHLKTWKDGMRHLLVILKFSPSFFFNLSVIGFLISWFFLIISYFIGKTDILFFSIFDIHTMLIGALLTFVSSSIWGIGLMLEDNSTKYSKMYNPILNLSEDKLFFITLFNITLFLIFILYVFLVWINNNMIYLNFQKEMIIVTSFLATIFNINIFVLCFNILKNNRK